ncbi:hypothetical protein ASPACDRAFT_61664 [Aspergillus aculeatus ATCC 16872]|uniref:Jacalin-type lectin domain-containing protein n=1 Tax=Aspergillus aculeatus (strain ATCC 16872 / CBS 172.66 / WB 5094) TaxID=690307 RepID=A0A1L9WS13_ASPA1|nr:uncharacterized protein ASPACDRAFT_61664 [Aspergillus aculeatus ATCC 16872]OJJ98990.1 hypothetical protein ASPACDRAFT_61664 [Aspergillus aculeatus ATCC 16872]
MADDNIVPNATIGEGGGPRFRASEPNDQVKRIEIWHGNFETEDNDVIRGIRVEWKQAHPRFWGVEQGIGEEIILNPPDERITHFIIAGGAFIDRIEIMTNKKPIERIGGPGGISHEIDVGSGYLSGFFGTGDAVIHSLSPLMFKFSNPPPNLAPNQTYGGGGGSPFWACRIDGGYTLKTLRAWQGVYDGSFVVTGIKIDWSDGTSTRQFGRSSGQEIPFDFEDDETIVSMKIRSGKYLDYIYIKTSSRGHVLNCGGGGGDEHTISVGNGQLVGLQGSSGETLDSLGPIFIL